MRLLYAALRPASTGLQRDMRSRPLAATLLAHRRILTGKGIVGFFSLPLVTLKVFAAIHWEALRLWLKVVRLAPGPDRTADGGLAAEARSDYTSDTKNR